MSRSKFDHPACHPRDPVAAVVSGGDPQHCVLSIALQAVSPRLSFRPAPLLRIYTDVKLLGVTGEAVLRRGQPAGGAADPGWSAAEHHHDGRDRAWCWSPPSCTPPATSGSAGLLLLLSGVADTLDGQVARGGAMVTKFGAFYDSTLDRVGDGATFIGIGAFFMTAPDVAYRIPAVIVCMVAILSSLLVSYARARAEGLGLDCKVGIAQRAERILGSGIASLVLAPARTRCCSKAIVALLAVASIDHRGPALRVRLPARARADQASEWRKSSTPRSEAHRGGAARLARFSRERTVAVAEQTARQIAPAKGKLGVLCVGLGAVATTFIAGVENIRRGARRADRLAHADGRPSGSASAPTKRAPLIREFVPLAALDDLVFGAWDPMPDDAYAAALQGGRAGPARAPRADRRLPQGASSRCRRCSTRATSSGSRARTSSRARPSATWPRRCGKDIREFKAKHKCDRLVMVWCASTEIFISPGPAHWTLEAFEKAMDAQRPDHRAVDAVRLRRHHGRRAVRQRRAEPDLRLSRRWSSSAKSKGVPIGGKDFKTGQTMIKTVLSPMFKARMLGVAGWYSTNILGNRDGEVLDDPESFKTKEESKLGVLEYILQPQLYPELYGKMYHKVRINYYPPRGDNKEGWDNIDIFGWLGYPMQIKVDFLCRDSILAAPLVLDLALFFDLAQRAGLSGIQEWLSFYFKSPQVAPGLYPEHDLFIQQTKLKNTLRYLMGEEQITHLGSSTTRSVNAVTRRS